MRILLISFIIFFTLGATAQQKTVPASSLLTQNDYLHKSREQKTVATVCLVAGGVTAAVGTYIWVLAPIAGLSESGNVDGAIRTGRTMVIAGGSLIAVSIPLFNASKKNKNKAALYSGTSSISLPLKGTTTQLTVGLRIPISK